MMTRRKGHSALRFPNRKDGNYMYTNQKILSCLCLDLRGLGTLAAAIVVLSVPANANLILNGGFEVTGSNTVPFQVTASNLPDWSFSSSGGFGTAPVACVADSVVTCYPGGVNNLYSVTASPNGGNFYLDDGDPNYAGTLSQLITGLTPNAYYTVSFFQAAGQFISQSGPTTERWEVGWTGAPSQFSTLMNNPSGGFSGCPGNPPWCSQTLTFQNGNTTSATLSFYAVGTPGGAPPVVLLDGVDVEAAPEPAAYALIGAGMLGLFAVHRQRAKRR
jgi:hypothetical protein